MRTDVLDDLERPLEISARGEGTLRRALDHWAVGQRVRKRNADLEDVGTGAVERPQDISGSRHVRIRSRRVRDEARPMLTPQPGERVRQLRSHFSTVWTSLLPRPER